MKKRILPFIIMMVSCYNTIGQLTLVDPKGTKVSVDSSKWRLSGGNIINKNSGNVGIGINSPAFKLDVSAVANPLRLLGLQNGNATDSLITMQSGVIKKIAPIGSFIINKNDSTTASNGLNLNGKDVRLGGSLTQPTLIISNSNALTFVTGGAAFNITGLPNGTAATDSLVTVQNGTIRKLAPINTLIPNKNDSTTASNGLNLNGKDVRLGGVLTQATTVTSNSNALTFATGGAALNITGLTNGTAATDSLVTVQNGTIRKLAPISSFIPNKNDSTTASNGLNLNGKDVRLGGTLTQTTTIATNGNTLNITGLANGTAATDSLVTVQNGTIRKLAPINTFIPNKNDSTTASNGLNLNGKDVRLGGTLTQTTTVTSNSNALTFATGGAALNITGLTNGTAATDSLVTVQNGTIRKLAPINTFIPNKNDSTTASNGLNLNGKDVRLGGVLTQATTVTSNSNALTFATGGAALNITGLTNGTAATDSLVTVQNGTIRKLAPINTFIPNKNDSTTASNGLNLNGKDVRLGGTLTQATTIATNGNNFNITGLPNGLTATDSLITVQNGLIRKLGPINTLIPNNNDSTTASNGMNLNGKDVRLGGTLTQTTTIATNGNTLNITGLSNGTAATDSLVTVQNGTIRKLAPINTFIVNKNDSTTASNGLSLTGKDVRLGGTLTQATIIATSGNALNITGLPSSAATDSLVTINNTTGQLRKMPIADLQPRIVEIYDAAGTQALTTTFGNLALGTTTIADNGYTVSGGTITVAAAGTYKITLRVTVRVTNNTSSGGEFRLMAGTNAIPGTLGYTYQHNGNRLNGTVTIVKIVNLAAGTVVAGQGRRYSSNGNLSLVADGSSLLIEKIK